MNRIIYYVQPGDSLYTISQLFGVTVDEIKAANKLKTDTIFINEKLIIPVDFYYVKPGDNLFTIATLFRTTSESIMRLNELETPDLYVGQPLVIPLYTEAEVTMSGANVHQWAGTDYPVMATFEVGTRLPITGVEPGWYRVKLFDDTEGYISDQSVTVNVYDGQKPIINLLGFYTLEEGPTLPSSYEAFVNNTDNISSIDPFFYRINRNNPTQIEKFGEFTDEEVDTLVNIAHENNVKILPTVHNLLYERGNQEINKEILSQMLQTPETRNAFIQDIVELIRKHNFDGVNIDFEDAHDYDSEKISAFYTELGQVLDEYGYYLSADVPSRFTDKKVNPFSDPYDYEAIGKAVDEFVVMLYNEHGFPGSGPGPVVSSGWMKKVLDYAITKMPREKIIAAVSVFGFDFNLETDRAAYATYDSAMKLAEKYNKEIIFDEETQTPYFAYTDENGVPHEVWFENADSIKALIDIAWEYGIKGIALWRLGMEDPEIWQMLTEEVVVEK